MDFSERTEKLALYKVSLYQSERGLVSTRRSDVINLKCLALMGPPV